MSCTLPTAQLRAWLGQDVQIALGLPVVFDLRLPVAVAAGYVSVHALTVEQVFGRQAAVRQVAQESRFRITVVRPWPAGDLQIQAQKEIDADALLAVLQPDSHYHEVGHFPLVAQVSFEDGEDEQERVSKLLLEWTTLTFADHH